MRIALVVHMFPPSSLGGTEIYARNLARALSERHEVAVFYRDDGDGLVWREEWQECQGFRLLRVGRRFDAIRANHLAAFRNTFFNRDVERAFDRFLDETRPDLVHFHHVALLSYRLIAQVRQRGIPCPLTLHDYWFICPNSQLIQPDAQVCQGKMGGLNCARCMTARITKPWIKMARPAIALLIQLRNSLVRRAALEADLLITPSRFLMATYVAAGFPAHRFRWLENGIDVARIKAFVRRAADDDRLRVTYLGTLAWHKGVHILVQAAHSLSPDRFRLRLFGNLNTFPQYTAFLRQIANPSHTTFEGLLPNDMVGRILAETDVLVVPSIWYENSPVVIQEAFAAGVPVIASRLGALSEKVHDGIDGLLVPPGDVEAWRDALERVVNDAALRQRLRAGVRPAMTIREHVSQIEQTYRQLVGRKGER